MIPAAVDRAVVEILDTGKTLGTGSLVSAGGLVLTATHVVGARTSVTVRFIDDSTDSATLIEAGPPDWSLFQLSKPPPMDPIAIGTLGSVAVDVRWGAVGFANLRGGLRGGFHGIVRREGPTLELFCEELVGKTHDDARGISGAPCIVDGEAVAMITDVLRQNGTGEIITGQVEALPLMEIKPEKVTLPQVAAARLPWELAFTAPLQQVTDAERLMVAGTTRLKNAVSSPRLASQIARRMISEGVETTARVMKQIDRLGDAVVDEVMSLADTLWVRGIAAESFAQITDTKGIGAIETERDWCAVHHLKRAYEVKNQDKFTWKYVVVRNAYVEPIPARVLQKTNEALREKFSGTDEDIRRKVSKQCVTAFILGTPRDDVAAILRAAFPTLVIVFMSRLKSSSAAPANLVMVQPSVTPDDELIVEETNNDARDNL